MSEEITKDPPKTVPFNARIMTGDKDFIDEFFKEYAIQFPDNTKADAFNAFIKQFKAGLTTQEPVTIPMVLQPGQVIVSFNPEHKLGAKLTAMRRWLKNKEKIPADFSEQDFLNNLIETLLLAHISKHFDFLNREKL